MCFWLSIINFGSTRFKNKAHKSWNVRWLVALKSIFIWAPLPICNITCILLSIWSKQCLRCFSRMIEMSIDRLVGTISSLCSLGHSRHQKQIWSCKACEIIFLFFFTPSLLTVECYGPYQAEDEPCKFNGTLSQCPSGQGVFQVYKAANAYAVQGEVSGT